MSKYLVDLVKNTRTIARVYVIHRSQCKIKLLCAAGQWKIAARFEIMAPRSFCWRLWNATSWQIPRIHRHETGNIKTSHFSHGQTINISLAVSFCRLQRVSFGSTWRNERASPRWRTISDRGIVKRTARNELSGKKWNSKCSSRAWKRRQQLLVKLSPGSRLEE